MCGVVPYFNMKHTCVVFTLLIISCPPFETIKMLMRELTIANNASALMGLSSPNYEIEHSNVCQFKDNINQGQTGFVTHKNPCFENRLKTGFGKTRILWMDLKTGF